MKKSPSAIHGYVGILVALFSVVAVLTVEWSDLQPNVGAWIALVVLYFLSEYFDLYFHDENARFGLGTSEAILLPMVMGLTFSQVLVGISLAMAFERFLKRLGILKVLFNVASFGLAVTAAMGTWQALHETGSGFSVRNAFVGLAALFIFALSTHLFTAVAIALAEGRPVVRTSLAVAPTTLIATASSGLLGLFFAAAFLLAPWTVALFPVAMVGLYMANRAIIGQRRERERIQHIQAATRALASGAGFEGAVSGFLEAVRDVASAREARLALDLTKTGLGPGEGWSAACVRKGGEHEPLAPLPSGPFRALVDRVCATREVLLVNQDDSSSGALREELQVDSLIAVPIVDENAGALGVLMVVDRTGADDFGENDAQLLEALVNELILTIDSYRLFSKVTEERERFARIFNSSTEGICLIDSDGIVRAWNPAMEKISGYLASDLVGRLWSDKMMIRDREQRRVEGTELVQLAPETEVELVTREGPTRWVSVLAGPTQANDDPGWVVLVRDVSAQHELEQAKSDFLSTISHELRTPLTTIKGSLQVLERGPDRLPSDLAHQMIGVTTRGAERLERLVMNLLVVSQIESGVLPVFLEEVALDDVVLERIGIMLRDHERLEVIQKHEKLTVRGDRERIGQAIEHVLDNALKFGGPEGLITIEIERRNGYAHVAITDEGPGIPVADQDKIWERFSRLGDVLTRETQGAGVGLFIAKRSIDALEGELWVDSEPGKGSTFHLTVPLAHPMVVVQEEPA